jgi:hypothetical protein
MGKNNSTIAQTNLDDEELLDELEEELLLLLEEDDELEEEELHEIKFSRGSHKINFVWRWKMYICSLHDVWSPTWRKSCCWMMKKSLRRKSCQHRT